MRVEFLINIFMFRIYDFLLTQRIGEKKNLDQGMLKNFPSILCS